LQFAICNLQLYVALLSAFAIAVATAPVHAEVTKLQWGSQRTTVTTQSRTQPALQFARPTLASQRHIDPAIQQAAYEGDAPLLTSGREVESRTRSVVVSREDELPEEFRAAQLPQTTATDSATPEASPIPSTDVPLRNPFSETPRQPIEPITPPVPEVDPPAAPENQTGLPAANDDLLQLTQQPQAEQPAAGLPAPNRPVAAPPDTGFAEPILPSGPVPPEQAGPLPSTTDAATIKAEGVKAKESCEKSLENLRAFTVDKVKLDISVTGTEGEDYPFECSIDDGSAFSGRCWDQTTYMWKASALCHKPLYFEDEQLERYGHSFSPCFQPFISGAHFFCTLPVLPYCMGVEPPCECVYALGHYRPGNCAPYMCNPAPLSLRGATVQAGVMTGAAVVFP
jgi:hypothetical protein